MKKLLLIDDEINLLESLKEGLLSESHIFTTQIAFSVEDAKKLINKNKFDLIITDIRMPEKSGLELLIYLKENKYFGEVMVMTAYGDAETSAYVKVLGGAKVIAKPFDFEWFKQMLIEFFTKEGFSGTIDSIDLTTLLQVIHLEKKTTGIEIKINDDTGHLYFTDGELINAEYKKLTGEDAAIKLISLNKGHFNVIKNKKSLDTLIKIPFMNFLMGVMKDIDEIVENEESDLTPKKKIILKDQILLLFKEIDGFKWIVFFDELENIVLKDINEDLKTGKYISMFNSILDSAEFAIKKKDHGNIDFFLIQTDEEIFVFSELKKNEIRMIISLNIYGDLIKTKLIIKKIANTIEEFIS